MGIFFTEYGALLTKTGALFKMTLFADVIGLL